MTRHDEGRRPVSGHSPCPEDELGTQIKQRLGELDWGQATDALDAQGWTKLSGLLSERECDALSAAYGPGPSFRSQVVMARHGFGQGEYRYFAYPLPPIVQALRNGLYTRLTRLADHWHERMGFASRFPRDHQTFLERCHQAGQCRPTPLLLQYGPGDHNCLHQDLYGEQVFPLQAALLLSQPGRDFTGGEFVITEQRPRMQSRAHVVALAKGDCVIFAVNSRPKVGSRGDYRVALRHGVSTVTSGKRHTLGIIFHDAS